MHRPQPGVFRLPTLQIASDKDLAAIVAEALREDFGDDASAIKKIGAITKANLNTIANWYQGKHVPSSRHLLHLARMSVSILRVVLLHIGADDLWDAFRLFQNRDGQSVWTDPQPAPVVRSPPTDITTLQTSPRKRWLVDELHSGRTVTAETLAIEFTVSIRTARRDIAELKIARVLEFVGAKKTGRYYLAGSITVPRRS